MVQKVNRHKARCPLCEEVFLLSEKEVLLFMVMRCPGCHTRLQVTRVAPVTLAVFRSHGLECVDGDGRVV